MYIIQEIQTTNGQTALLPAVTKSSRNEAESVFYTICSAAAISSIEVHTAIIYDEHGNVLMRQFFEHLAEE